jgi:hypothetical protein
MQLEPVSGGVQARGRPRSLRLLTATVVIVAGLVLAWSFRSAFGGGGSAAPGTGSIVDGFPLGARADAATAQANEALAIEALETRLGSHADIVSATAYQEDIRLVHPDAQRSGTLTVYLFALADGSYHAAGVYCGVGGCGPVPVYN